MSGDPAAIMQSILRAYRKGYADNEVIQSILKKLEQGGIGYADLLPYAEAVGKQMSAALAGGITGDCVADGFLNAEIASDVVRPSLVTAYDAVAEASATVQQGINQSAGISFRAIKGTPDTDRLENFITKLTGSEFEKTEWLLHDDVIGNFARSAISDTIRANAELHRDAGIHPYLSRYSAGHCCAWCDAICGVFEFGQEPENFWKIHKQCNCVIEYKPSKYRNTDIISYRTDTKGNITKHTKQA